MTPERESLLFAIGKDRLAEKEKELKQAIVNIVVKLRRVEG